MNSSRKMSYDEVSMKWQSEDISALISLVKAEKCLYDTEYEHYKAKLVMDKAWAHIAEKLDRPAYHCKDKWNALRSHKRKLYNKIIIEGEPRHLWEHSNQLSFLEPQFAAIKPTNFTELMNSHKIDKINAKINAKAKALATNDERLPQPPPPPVADRNSMNRNFFQYVALQVDTMPISEQIDVRLQLHELVQQKLTKYETSLNNKCQY